MIQVSLNLWWFIAWGCLFGWALEIGELLYLSLAIGAVNLTFALIGAAIEWLELREFRQALKEQEMQEVLDAIFEPKTPDIIRGDCRFYSGMAALKCAVNPANPCQVCTQFEPKKLGVL